MCVCVCAPARALCIGSQFCLKTCCVKALTGEGPTATARTSSFPVPGRSFPEDQSIFRVRGPGPSVCMAHAWAQPTTVHDLLIFFCC